MLRLDLRVVSDAEATWDREWSERTRYVKLFEGGRFPLDEGGNSQGASVNLCFNYVMLMTALLMRQDPVFDITARRPGESPDLDAFAQAVQAWEEYSYVEDGTVATNAVILFDAMLRGLGWSKEHFDPQTGTDRVDSVLPMDLYVDPAARYKLGQARYVVQRVVMPIEEAREFFGKSKLEPNHSLADDMDHQRVRVDGDLQESSARSLLKVYEIWRKVSGGGRRLSYVLWDAKKTLDERPWPYILDGEEFPFTPLAFNTVYDGIRGFSEEKVVDGLVREVEELVEWDRRHTRRTAARKVLVDDTAFKNKGGAVRSNKDMSVIPVKRGNVPMEHLYHVMDLTAGTNAGQQKGLYERALQLHNMLLGIDRIIQGGENQTRLTATEAEIRQDSSDLRSSGKRSKIDQFLETQMRHRVQIARLLVDPERVGVVAGDRCGWAWATYAGNAEDIVQELFLQVKAGSSSALFRARRLQELRDNFGLAQAVNGAAVQLQGRPVFDETRMALEIFRHQGERNPERWLLPAPEPQGVPAGGMPAEAAQMQELLGGMGGGGVQGGEVQGAAAPAEGAGVGVAGIPVGAVQEASPQ